MYSGTCCAISCMYPCVCMYLCVCVCVCVCVCMHVSHRHIQVRTARATSLLADLQVRRIRAPSRHFLASISPRHESPLQPRCRERMHELTVCRLRQHFLEQACQRLDLWRGHAGTAVLALVTSSTRVRLRKRLEEGVLHAPRFPWPPRTCSE